MTTDDDLSALSGRTDDEILQDGVHAAGILYAAAALEELRLIETVERLNELNQHKMLNIGAGEASNLLHEFWDQGYKRMPEKRRLATFARVFGAPAGDGAAAESNDAFGDLFAALVTALADGPATDVAPAASALRDNLAEHTDEAASKAAVELRRAYAEIGAVLSDLELRRAFGAGDLWQVVAHVQAESGGDADIEGARARAAAGAAILHRVAELAGGAEADATVVAAARSWVPASSPAA